MPILPKSVDVEVCPADCTMEETNNNLPPLDKYYKTSPGKKLDSGLDVILPGDSPEANWNNHKLYPDLPEEYIVKHNEKDRPIPYYPGISKSGATKIYMSMGRF